MVLLWLCTGALSLALENRERSLLAAELGGSATAERQTSQKHRHASYELRAGPAAEHQHNLSAYDSGHFAAAAAVAAPLDANRDGGTHRLQKDFSADSLATYLNTSAGDETLRRATVASASTSSPVRQASRQSKREMGSAGADDEHAPLHSPLRPHRPKVVYIGLPKAGTTSFHSFFQEQLGLHSLHCGGDGGFLPMLSPTVTQQNNEACQQQGAAKPVLAFRPSEPLESLQERDTDQIQNDGLTSSVMDRLYCLVNVSKYVAFADGPFSMLYQLLDKVDPAMRYVLWEPPRAEWINSVTNFWSAWDAQSWEQDGADLRYAFNICNVSNRTALGATFTSYHRQVRDYFYGPAAPPSRRERLLEVDFANDPLAGRKVCEHSLGRSDPRCAGLGAMPVVDAKLFAGFSGGLGIVRDDKRWLRCLRGRGATLANGQPRGHGMGQHNRAHRSDSGATGDSAPDHSAPRSDYASGDFDFDDSEAYDS